MRSIGCFICAMIFFHSIVACEKKGSEGSHILSSGCYSQETKIYPLVVIGSGAAGMMAVNRAVLNNNEVLLFTGSLPEQRHSRGTWVKKVDNIPGLAKCKETVLELRAEVLEELINSPLGHNLYVRDESVYSIEKEGDVFKLTDGTGCTFYAYHVVLATGVMNEQPMIQGSIRPVLLYANSQNIGYCTVCDGHRCYGKETVVIGHSNYAAFTALRLNDMYQPPKITILTNGLPHEFSASLLQQLQDRNIEVLEAPISEVLGNQKMKKLTGFSLEDGCVVQAEIGFISLGLLPNNQLAVQLGAQLDEEGLVITDSKGESSVPNFFVAGDLRSDSMMQIYTAWQDAVVSVQEINWRIRERASR